MDKTIERGLLIGAIMQALKETKRGIYLRSYANRVAKRAIELYEEKAANYPWKR